VTQLTDSELESQLKRDEMWWDAHGGIPEIDINPHTQVQPCTCTPDKCMCVYEGVRYDNLVTVYQCQECGNEKEYVTPIDETEFMS
jgi:hypothetical protein